MTLLQMAAMYQAIANDGVRIAPRIIVDEVPAPTIGGYRPDASRGVRVVSPATAKTVREMFRAVVQNDPDGRADGYRYQGGHSRVSGVRQDRNGPAEPRLRLLPNDAYNITFAGIAPADKTAVRDRHHARQSGTELGRSGGQSAAPLFADIASWLLQRDRVPLSAHLAPRAGVAGGLDVSAVSTGPSRPCKGIWRHALGVRPLPAIGIVSCPSAEPMSAVRCGCAVAVPRRAGCDHSQPRTECPRPEHERRSEQQRGEGDRMASTRRSRRRATTVRTARVGHGW